MNRDTHENCDTKTHTERDIEVERCLKFLHTIWCTSIAIIRQQVFECYSRRVTETDFSIGKHYFGLNRLYMYVAYNINDLFTEMHCTRYVLLLNFSDFQFGLLKSKIWRRRKSSENDTTYSFSFHKLSEWASFKATQTHTICS